MKKQEDKNTRYFIEVDLRNMKVANLDFGDKYFLANQESHDAKLHRIYLTKGQYHKFIEKVNKKT
jgi:hypothetical protein